MDCPQCKAQIELTNRLNKTRWAVVTLGTVFAVLYLLNLPSPNSSNWIFWVFIAASPLDIVIKRWQLSHPRIQLKQPPMLLNQPPS